MKFRQLCKTPSTHTFTPRRAVKGYECRVWILYFPVLWGLVLDGGDCVFFILGIFFFFFCVEKD